MEMVSRDIQRTIIGGYWLLFSGVMIILDGAGIIDVGKWGYAAFFSIITLIIQFYFRKSGDKK